MGSILFRSVNFESGFGVDYMLSRYSYYKFFGAVCKLFDSTRIAGTDDMLFMGHASGTRAYPYNYYSSNDSGGNGSHFGSLLCMISVTYVHLLF